MHDADGSVIQSLSLNILGENKSALSSIDETITALVSLQATAVRMRDGVNVIKDLADSLQKLSKVKIPNSVPEQLQKIDAALKGTYGKGASGMKNVADAMQDIADNANKLPIAEQFDKGAHDVGAFNSELKDTKENLQEIKDTLANFRIGALGQYLGLSDNRMLQGAIGARSQYMSSGLGLPEKSQAQAMKILEETAIDLGKIKEYQTDINTQDTFDISNLKDANAELDKASVKLAELSRGNNRININAGAPFPTYPTYYGSASSYTRPNVYDDAKMPVLADTMVSLQPAIVDTEKLSGEVESLAVNMDGANTSAKGLKKSLDSVGASPFKVSVKEFGERLKELKDKTIGTNSGFGKLAKSIKRIATYRAIRAALKAITNGFKEGTTNLYKWSDAFDSTREFANSMDRIATATLYVKNSLGAMVAPIINAVAPALDFLADKFVGLLNIVNEFFAALTGASTYTVAKKIATKFQDIGDSASGAAKAMKSFTIGIDELNIIEDTAGGRGGAGTLGDVTEDWFEKQAVSSKMQNIADKVRDIADKVHGYLAYMVSGEGISDLGEWGATHIVEPVVNAWESVKGYWEYMTSGEGWGDIPETIGNWGADGITGLAMAWDDFKVTVLKALDPIVETGFEIANSIKKFFSNVYDGISQLAKEALKHFKKLDPYLKLASGLAGGILGLKSSSQGAQEQGENDAKSYTSGFESTLKSWLVAFATPYGALLGNTTSKSAENAKTYVRPAAMSLGTSIINGAKDGVSANANSLYSKIGSIGQTTVSTFKNNASYSSFKSAGENIVNGIIAGLDAKKGQVYNSISVLASKTGSKFNYTLKIQSPSRVFMESGEYIDEGLALGIDRNAYKVEDSVAKLSNTFTNFAPAIDTSKLSIPDAQALYGDVQGAITADSKVSVQRADESLQNFIMETLMPVVTRIADDTKRQADKSEVIEIDGRKLNDSLNRQSRNNGYSFT